MLRVSYGQFSSIFVTGLAWSLLDANIKARYHIKASNIWATFFFIFKILIQTWSQSNHLVYSHGLTKINIVNIFWQTCELSSLIAHFAAKSHRISLKTGHLDGPSSHWTVYFWPHPYKPTNACSLTPAHENYFYFLSIFNFLIFQTFLFNNYLLWMAV